MSGCGEKEGVRIKGEAGRLVKRPLQRSKTEMMKACTTVQGNGGDDQKYLASGYI